MVTVREIYDVMDVIAPFRSALDWDNVGLLVGDWEQKVLKVLLSLDFTEQVVEEAAELHAELIISHHPVIFNAVKTIVREDSSSHIPYLLARKNISAICAHTNLDVADGGVNDVLAGLLGLENIKKMEDQINRDVELFRMGRQKESMDVLQFAESVKNRLHCGVVRVADAGRPVHQVAVCGGAGSFLLNEVIKSGADTFVTADVKHHEFIEAKQRKINLLDAGHFATENGIVVVLAKRLSAAFRETEFIVSKNQNPVLFV